MENGPSRSNAGMTSDIRPVLILHIGQTKAGSTAIQNYLDDQRTALLGQGFLFPAYGFSRANPHDLDRTSGHLALIRKIAGKTALQDKELAALKDQNRLILSAENLFLDCSDAELSALGEFFRHYRIIVVLVVRSIDAWLASRYVEDVMSGFKSITSTFADFQEHAIAKGSHDYGGRLDRVVSLLKAAEVRLINYDFAAGEEGIVPAFLKAANIPVTNPDLASSIRSNIRANPAFLLEGKRRLNHMLQKIPSAEKLKIEQELRDHARISQNPQPAPSVLPVCLTQQACKEVADSNQHLVTNYGLWPTLSDIQPATQNEYSHRNPIPGVDDFVCFGLKAISELLGSEEELSSGKVSQTLLEWPETSLLIDLLAKNRVTLHLDSPETALWAACYSDKLPLLLTHDSDPKALDHITSAKLPSDVICATALDQLSRLLRSRQPEAVIVRPGMPPQIILESFTLARDDAVLVLAGHEKDEVLYFVENMNLEIAASGDRIFILKRPDQVLDCREHPA